MKIRGKIPKARAILEDVIANDVLPVPVRMDLIEALALMTRVSPIRRAPNQMRKITAYDRSLARKIARENPELSQAEIARRVGLGPQAAGRISEILHRLR